LDLKDKVKDKYDYVSLHVKVSAKKRSLGEIDLIARKGNKVDLYEFKCSHRILKAKKQLNRMKRVLNLKKANSYFYCGSSGIITDI
jgi:Holliday junction resolvase-like predicted endonuclease